MDGALPRQASCFWARAEERAGSHAPREQVGDFLRQLAARSSSFPPPLRAYERGAPFLSQLEFELEGALPWLLHQVPEPKENGCGSIPDLPRSEPRGSKAKLRRSKTGPANSQDVPGGEVDSRVLKTGPGPVAIGCAARRLDVRVEVGDFQAWKQSEYPTPSRRRRPHGIRPRC